MSKQREPVHVDSNGILRPTKEQLDKLYFGILNIPLRNGEEIEYEKVDLIYEQKETNNE